MLHMPHHIGNCSHTILDIYTRIDYTLIRVGWMLQRLIRLPTAPFSAVKKWTETFLSIVDLCT